jgi:hypothetical protein
VKTDDLALLFIAVAIVLIGVMTLIAAWVLSSPRRPERSKRAPDAAPARTAKFSRAELSDLLHQVHDETVLIRRVDQTELPGRARAGRRRVGSSLFGVREQLRQERVERARAEQDAAAARAVQP